MKLSRNLENFELSAISRVFAMVKDLRAEGREIVDLCVGEPDFDTPEHVKEAAHQAALAGDTKYTVIDGTAALKESICRKLKRENGLDFSPKEISVGAGAKTVLHTTLTVLVDPDDEVVLLTPAWGSYAEMLGMLGAKKVLVRGEANNGFRITPVALRAALSARTRAIVINSPSNPAGATYSHTEFEALAEVLREYPDVWVISDEIYEHILFTGEPYVSFLAAAPDFRHRTVTINGVSKAYAMTGWRIGWAAAPAGVILAMRKVISNSTSSPCTISQAAAVAALEGPKTLLAERNAVYRHRGQRLMAALEDAPSLKVVPPGGAFYLYLDCGEMLKKMHPKAGVLTSSFDVVRALLEHHGLAVVHGAAFQHDPAFRLSFAASENSLARAAGILRDFAACLR
ncbi:pyridoxal phosphate-dependent aminotransferase [Mesorhizobium sp. IMUNJ 23033]|uniref:pyridoxal phosphate-dependent aminotransferase n=1 Tax=Mesorhizobium sp. IMUNJ 23033 TaxID=3378039 RepID=UPI0038501775